MKSFSKYIFIFLIVACVSGMGNLKAGEPVLKKRVAVFVFDDKTDKTYRWWNQKSAGEGISEMLTTELVKSEKYRVIERQELQRILQEQDLGASGVVTPQSAAQLGKVLGVELAVMGAVTEFGYRNDQIGGGIKLTDVQLKKQNATVAVDVRLVNTTTAEIIAAENVREKKSTAGVKLRTKGLRFGDQKSFDESLIGKVARQAIEEIVGIIATNADKIPWQAKIITNNNGAVFINSGESDGIKPGDTFVVYKEGQELIDPDTGISLGSIESKIGAIRVTNASIGNGKASQCAIVEGSGFAKGDLVRIK